MSTWQEEALRKIADELMQQAKTMTPVLVGDLVHRNSPYVRYVEYGKPPVTGTTIESTAAVIDDEVLALPAPIEG